MQPLSDNNSSICPKEAYEVAREQIKREDDLVNFRTTWFLAVQALLFAAMFQGVLSSDLDKSTLLANSTWPLFIAAHGIAGAGIVAAIAWAAAVRGALLQIEYIEKWWRETSGDASQYPRVAGKHGGTVLGIRVNAVTAAAIMCAIWGAVVVLLWIFRK